MALDKINQILPSRNLESTLEPNQVKPRSRDALEVFDELEEKKLHEYEDIFNE